MMYPDRFALADWAGFVPGRISGVTHPDGILISQTGQGKFVSNRLLLNDAYYHGLSLQQANEQGVAT